MKTDVLIIGGGPAGATSAMRLLQRGIRPLIVERETFPRYHIGESMTGEAGALVADLGFADRMEAAGHPVKHGVNVFGTRGDANWWVPMTCRSEGGEAQPQRTWQVRRSVFDKMLLDGATSRGADFLPGRALEPLLADDGRTVRGARVRTDDGAELDVEAEITLDCSGQGTFLANRGATGPKYLGSYDKQIALFTQIAGYRRDDGGTSEFSPGNAHIFYKEKYKWAWAIPIGDEVTSVGIVVPSQYFLGRGESKRDFILRELKELNPGLGSRVPDYPELLEGPRVIPNYSYQVRRFAGPGYICIGDAHRFIDPIFSFGLYVAIKEATLAAGEVERYLAGVGRGDANPFEEHMVRVERGIDLLEDMIDTFWENPFAFAVFAHRRFRDAVLDLFSGRIFDDQPTQACEEAMVSFRELLNRERTYDREGLYSVPIGSRYRPERAPLWNSRLDSVETTERWIRGNT